MTEATKGFKGTQIVFCDLSTPKVRFENYTYGTDFDAYNDLKFKLVQMGIPKEQIAFIHEASTDEQKQALFDEYADRSAAGDAQTRTEQEWITRTVAGEQARLGLVPAPESPSPSN